MLTPLSGPSGPPVRRRPSAVGAAVTGICRAVSRWRGIAAPLLVALGLLAPLASAAEDRVRVVVAVLPFEVHSEKPLDYLEGSLAELLATRLEASGEVEVVEALTVRETLVAWPGERSEDALRRLAQELDADWVVVGSLTELAGQYSLDVRVTPARSRVTTSTLVYSANGDDELLDRVNELARRILGIVNEADEAARVARVEVLGAPDEEAVRAAIVTREGEVFDGDDALRDVERIESLPGVAAARLETDTSPDGLLVIYHVVGDATAPLDPSSTPPPGADVVAALSVRGNKRIESAAILARVTHKVGEPFSVPRLAADVRGVYALGFFRDVTVYEESGPDGISLIFEVEENPVVRQVTLSGNDNVDGEKIKDILTLTTGSTLDYPLLFENRQRIEGLYRAEGYYLAKVSSEVETLTGDAVGVNFEVNEGKKLRLRAIEFEGNEDKTNEELSKGLKTKTWRWYSFMTSWLDKTGTYSEPVFMQDLETVSNRYLDDGYVRADVGTPEVIPEEDGLIVRVPVVEGDQYRLGRASLSGDDATDFAGLREDMELAEGDVFSRSKLNADLQALESFYTDRGFFMAQVRPLTAVNEDEKLVDVDYSVEKGSLYFLREIDVSGNQTTVDPVVRREVRLVEGQLYSARALDLSRRRIQGLGYFEEVNFEPRQTDFGNQLDLDVKVVEKPTGSISFGAGVSSRDGFVISGAVADSNLFGRGLAASLGGDIGGDSERFFLNFAWPYFLDSTWGLSTQLSTWELEFDDFKLEQSGIEVALSHALEETGRTRGFIRYGFSDRALLNDLFASGEFDSSGNIDNQTQGSNSTAASMIYRDIVSGSKLSEPTAGDPKSGCTAFGDDPDNPTSPRFACLKGGGDSQITSLIGLGFRRDTRNDRVAATDGHVIESSVEFAGIGGFSKFVRWEGRAGFFLSYPDWFPEWVPFKESSAWLLGLRAGYAHPLNDVGDWDLPSFDGNLAEFNIGDSVEMLPLDLIDEDLELPLSERYFLGGLGSFQLRGFKARSVGPRRAVLQAPITVTDSNGVTGTVFTPVGVAWGTGVCADEVPGFEGNGNGKCNSLDDEHIDDFDDLDETDVIGGNKFTSVTIEYRFPIAESFGLMGIVFFDTGNAFDETQDIWDFSDWRQGAGAGLLWFSPFGPLQVFLGVPIDRLEDEDSTAFEFSVGGHGF
jgi:outer membrane protein assembly complex protein YaeT